MKKNLGRFILLFLIIVTVFCGLTFEFLDIQYKDSIVYSDNDIESLEPYPPLSLNVCKEDDDVTFIYKLFKFLGIKKLKGNKVSEKEVYIGGQPIGVSIGVDGVLVAGTNEVITNNGIESPAKDIGLQEGDILLSINGIKTNSPTDVTKILLKVKSKNIRLEIQRGSKILEKEMELAVDSLSHQYKMGLYIKDNVSGVGTMTYIKENGRYGALGHYIIDADLKDNSVLNKGDVYNCNIMGVIKGTKGTAGELRGVFSKNPRNKIGSIDKNTNFGIFGKMNSIPKNAKKVKVTSEKNIKHGKAYIYTTIKGNKPDFYEIEIIKTISQNMPEEKSMVISIIDKRLKNSTGGIVQGMSGSPIIQDGYLIGAVTHVFINDPTKGYGVYINWMFNADK